MNVLICGDIVGISGRNAIEKHLPRIKKKFSPDFILLNVDNAAGGFGITADVANSFFKLGANILTGGNHVFDQNGVAALLENDRRVLRPYNLPASIPGFGVSETLLRNGKTVVVVHLIGQRYMPLTSNDPFESVAKLLTKYTLGKNVAAILVDFHAELTSEKNAMGHFLDGKVSAVVGTHTHIPTSDERILEFGTAFQTDIGMTGDYDSIIGMKKESAIVRFTKIHSRIKFLSATGDGTLCGLIVEIDDDTGLAKSTTPIRLGGRLSQTDIDSV